jgi:tRNA G46 methylase TrmB
VLDSFCGTGQSTAMLAARHDDALVIGVDKSSHRLNRRPAAPDNCVLLQAHCEAVWRYLVGRQQKLLAHYLLYPNPWPKPGHLSRRVHGHPAFPLLLALGGQLELRSNWQLYVEEFGVALHLLHQPSCIAVVPADAPALTLFEHKYRESGHQLWSVTAKLS